MRYRTLGRSGDEVSILGLGCMRLPVIDGDEGCIDEAQASRLLHLAVEGGINYLDTAYPYHKGQGEIFLGRALRGGLRQKFRLATKLNCTGCGRCEALCPQHIPITDLLVKSHRVLSEKIED